MDCAANNEGFNIAKCITRGSDVCLHQLLIIICNAKSATLFKLRAARGWNALPTIIYSIF